MSKNIPQNPDQAQLFDDKRSWNDPEATAPLGGVPITYGEPGTYVDVEERAKLLIASLTSFSQRNFRRTFPLATYSDEHSPPIWARYQENTESVVVPGTRRNAAMYERFAAHSFWHATGFSALKRVVGVEEIIRPKQIDERATKMWRDFNDLYAEPKNVKARNKYKKQLGKFVTTQAGSSEEQAA